LLGAIIIAAVAVDQWRVHTQNSIGTQQLNS